MEGPPHDPATAGIVVDLRAGKPLHWIQIQLGCGMEQGRPGSLLRLGRIGRRVYGDEPDDRCKADLSAVHDEGVVIELLRQAMEAHARAPGGRVGQDQREVVSRVADQVHAPTVGRDDVDDLGEDRVSSSLAEFRLDGRQLIERQVREGGGPARAPHTLELDAHHARQRLLGQGARGRILHQVLARDRSPIQASAHPQCQLLTVDGLGDHVVGAQFERAQERDQVGAPGQDDGGHGSQVRVGAQLC
jgi:hypothetical protein